MPVPSRPDSRSGCGGLGWPRRRKQTSGVDKETLSLQVQEQRVKGLGSSEFRWDPRPLIFIFAPGQLASPALQYPTLCLSLGLETMGTATLGKDCGRLGASHLPASSHSLPFPFSSSPPQPIVLTLHSPRVAGGHLSTCLAKLQIWMPSPPNTHSR